MILYLSNSTIDYYWSDRNQFLKKVTLLLVIGHFFLCRSWI